MSFRDRVLLAWETGKVVSDGWETGEVDEAPYQNEGSHTPPPRDRDGGEVAVKRVAGKYLQKTAGEVRFVKDRSGDGARWGWDSPGTSGREISPEYEFELKNLKPLSKILRSSLVALGHVMSAHTAFSKVKSRTVSPDGALGGKGYIQKITDMRRQYMNVVEALSALTDTLYDEVNAPHWNPPSDENLDERDDVKEIMEDVEEIRENPEEFAREEEKEMDEENVRTASSLVRRTAQTHVRRRC